MNRSITFRRTAILLLTCITGLPHLRADEKPAESKLVKHQITGLFCPEREKDFKDLCARKLARFKLVNLDYENAEAMFDYDPAKEFPGANAEQVIERFDNEVRNASRHTFGAKALRTTPKEKLKLVEFAIVGLDCKACSLAVYEIIYRLKGVEQATASFKLGKATALIDPEKTDRAEIEKALKDRGVTVKPAE
jgi:copper chaperone CopZ